MTEEESLYTGDVMDITAFITACDFPLDSYVLVERQPKTIIEEGERQNLLRFDRLRDIIDKVGIDLASYTSGRVFHESFELRWEQDAVKVGEASVVYIGEERELPGLKMSKWTVQPEDKNKEYSEKQHEYYLFGELLDQDKQGKMSLDHEEGYEYYAETRIPRLLRYPDPEQGRHAQRLKLTAREYRLTDQDGYEQGRAYRFLNLIEAKEDKHEPV